MKKEFLGLGILLVAIGILIPNIYLSSTSEKEGIVRVELTVYYGQVTKSNQLFVKNGSTVFDALNKSHTAEYKEYAGLGKLITSIDGVEQNSTHAWFYWVNDMFSDKSSDNYAIIENSNVTFRIDDMSKFYS